MQCANCNADLREQDRFCPLCGAPVQDVQHPCVQDTENGNDELPGAAQPENSPKGSADGQPKAHRAARKPMWALLALLLIGFSTLVILLLANINLKSDKHAHLFAKGLLPVCVSVDDTPTWGYMDKEGTVVIAAAFDEARPFADNGLAAVKQGEKWGYIDTAGTLVIPCTLDEAGDFTNGSLAPAKLGVAWGYIDESGKTAINPQFDTAYGFSENGLALVCIGGKWGFINRRGVYVINPQFENAEGFDEDGYATVRAFGKWGMIDHNGNYVINPQFDESFSFSDNGFAVIKQGDRYGYINRNGSFVVDALLLEAEPFSRNGLALAKTEGGKYGYINTRGDWAIQPELDDALSFADNGLAAVCPNSETGLWGYIDRHGEFKIAPTYKEASSFSCGLAAVRGADGYHYIDEEGAVAFRLTCLDSQLKLPGVFFADGYAILHCYTLEEGAVLPVFTHYEIINTKGAVIHTKQLATLYPSY